MKRTYDTCCSDGIERGFNDDSYSLFIFLDELVFEEYPD